MSEPFISELHLKNFKCYDQIKIPLNSSVSILYGWNGTGKTSILEGLAIAAGCFLSELPSTEIMGGDIVASQVKLAALPDMREPEFQFPAEVLAKGHVFGNEISWGRELWSFKAGIMHVLGDQMTEASKRASKIMDSGEKTSLPVIAFFSTKRLFVPRLEELDHPGRIKGYFNAISGNNTQGQIRNWLRDAEFQQYQRRQSTPTYFDAGLKGIYDRVLSEFKEEWERIYYFEPSDAYLPKGLFFVSHDHSKATIPESNLSDGYRNFVWLVLEIAWRCYVLNPYLGENAAAETNGIVMIDEVDLHMHPKWQQKIVGVLAKAFPKIQFVITTHSPIVLGSVKDGQVILLEGQTAKVVPAPYGLTPSYILESYMGIEERLPELREDIRRYFELINEGKGKEEVALNLRKRLAATMSPNDPIFAEADALLFYLA
jgi:predicted ATP-binding protein involved in virulence